MYPSANLSVNGDIAVVDVVSHNGDANITMLGATFDTHTIPNHTVHNQSARFTESLPATGSQAMALRMSYENARKQSDLVVVLFRRSGEKLVADIAAQMKAGELAFFNPFSVIGDVLVVSDVDQRVRYVSSPVDNTEKDWTYKQVPFDSLLEHICDYASFAELDKEATSAQLTRNELAELRTKNAELNQALRSDNEYTQRLRDKYIRQQCALFELAQMVQDLLNLRIVHWLSFVNRAAYRLRRVSQAFVSSEKILPPQDKVEIVVAAITDAYEMK